MTCTDFQINLYVSLHHFTKRQSHHWLVGIIQTTIKLVSSFKTLIAKPKEQVFRCMCLLINTEWIHAYKCRLLFQNLTLINDIQYYITRQRTAWNEVGNWHFPGVRWIRFLDCASDSTCAIVAGANPVAAILVPRISAPWAARHPPAQRRSQDECSMFLKLFPRQQYVSSEEKSPQESQTASSSWRGKPCV